MQLEAKIISTCQNKSYCYQLCWDCRVCSWGTNTNEIPPNAQRCCLLPTILTWYNSILLLKLLEHSRRKKISLHFRPLLSLCYLGLASFWNIVLPTSAPTSCHRIYQLTQGTVLPAALGNHIPDPFIKSLFWPQRKQAGHQLETQRQKTISSGSFHSQFLRSCYLLNEWPPPTDCCNSWLQFGHTASCGEVPLPCCVWARLLCEGNFSCPMSHCFEEKTQPPPAVWPPCSAKTKHTRSM